MIKLLIADDEYMEREMLSGIIESHFGRELDVRLAENGRHAVDVATLWGADIILMDIEMPGLNGIDAAKQILAQRQDCKVIFITAYSLFSYAHEAVRLGASDYLLKPVNAEEVERAVRLAVVQVESQRQLAAMAAAGDAAQAEGPADKSSVLMSKVKRYLKHNYMLRDISLDSVSEILNINPSYFSVLFKRAFGVNFVDYLTELRMSAAKELLMDPLRSTAEVASMVGYESANYFTRAFKKKTGMTPTEYRRGALQGPEGSGL